MCFFTLNIIGFVNGLYLFFKYCVVPYDMKELIVIGVSSGIFVMTIFMFFYDPDPFDYFRYSFKRQELALLQYFLFLMVYVCTLVTILMFG